MQKELITVGELMSEVRNSGITDLPKVREACMQPSSLISVISSEEKEASRRYFSQPF